MGRGSKNFWDLAKNFLRSRKGGGLARGSRKDFAGGLHSWVNF